MSNRIVAAIAIASAAFALATIANPAHAFTRNVTLCNKSQGNVEVAWGYDLTGTSETRSEGWKTVRSCQCANLFRQDVRATEFFVYVTREGSAIDDALTSGTTPLCVRAKGFTIRASNKSRATCAESGGKWVNFLMANAPKENHTLNFGSGARCID